MLRTALQYSGGKDSRVVLHLMRDQLADILVVWCNAGDPYEETLAHMRKVQSQVPNFLMIKGDQKGQIARNGFPSDVVPMNYSPLGNNFRGQGAKVQSTFGCCNENFWQPLHNAMLGLGIKRIIRGQRNTDEYNNSAFRHGARLGQFECVAPIQDWTDAQVFEYAAAHDIEIPDYYKTEMTGRDCWSCTGYLKHNAARIKNLPDEKRVEVLRRLNIIRETVTSEMGAFDSVLKAA